MDTRIRTESPADYPWPFVAILERRDGGEWVEIEAEGGDTADEAVATLRAEHRQARGLCGAKRDVTGDGNPIVCARPLGHPGEHIAGMLHTHTWHDNA